MWLAALQSRVEAVRVDRAGDRAVQHNGWMRRPVVVALVLVPLVLAAGFGIRSAYLDESSAQRPTLPAPRNPLRPDLVVSDLRDVLLSRKADGSRSLFFTAAVANIGDGPFLVRGVRRQVGDAWRVTQRFVERDGAMTERDVDGDLVFGGHGHEHWHVRLGASYRLVARVDGKEVRRLVKAGYCFFDQTVFRPSLRGAPRAPRFLAAGCNGIEARVVDMGLSVGWSDPYTWLLPDQRLDVTGLPDGVYRLLATADPDGWFDETAESNNEAWVDVRIAKRADGASVATVLRRSAPPR